jgi:hypothetical protein
MTIIPFQQTLNKPLEKVVGNADYLSELYFINRYDRLLSESGLEKSVIIKWLENGSAKKSALAKKKQQRTQSFNFQGNRQPSGRSHSCFTFKHTQKTH